MTARRSHFLPALPAVAVLLVLSSLQPVRAGVFDDDEARRQVRDLANQTHERLETLSKGQFELVNQIQALREENARLRGQLETLSYELDSAKKRQQDFYIDLDGRLRKLESLAVAGSENGEVKPAEDGSKTVVDSAKKPPVDPAAESRDYETALNYFKANKIKDAASAFELFGKTHPDSSLAPNAQYWLGNAYYALRDCKKSIEAHKQVLAKWPQHAKAPDSLLSVATCQQELGDAKGAKSTFETVLAKYPGTSAATTAKQRLKK